MTIFLRIPASTSNLGPGFDSIGMAVNLYLEVEATESETFVFKHYSDNLQSLPSDDTHYIAQMIKHFSKELGVEVKPLTVSMNSEIPLARGLGSSATALIAALLLVDATHRLNLSKEQQIDLLTKVEGHPDNVVPSLLGGLQIGYFDEKDGSIIEELPAIEWPLAVVIPDYEVKTKDARAVLPSVLDYSHAVKASAISNTLVATLATKNYDKAGRVMSQDLFHEPYRDKLVKEFKEIKSLIEGCGYIFLSGAGPTMFLMLKPEQAQKITTIKEHYPHFKVLNVVPDLEGAIVKY